MLTKVELLWDGHHGWIGREKANGEHIYSSLINAKCPILSPSYTDLINKRQIDSIIALKVIEPAQIKWAVTMSSCQRKTNPDSVLATRTQRCQNPRILLHSENDRAFGIYGDATIFSRVMAAVSTGNWNYQTKIWMKMYFTMAKNFTGSSNCHQDFAMGQLISARNVCHPVVRKIANRSGAFGLHVNFSHNTNEHVSHVEVVLCLLQNNGSLSRWRNENSSSVRKTNLDNLYVLVCLRCSHSRETKL